MDIYEELLAQVERVGKNDGVRILKGALVTFEDSQDLASIYRDEVAATNNLVASCISIPVIVSPQVLSKPALLTNLHSLVVVALILKWVTALPR